MFGSILGPQWHCQNTFGEWVGFRLIVCLYFVTLSLSFNSLCIMMFISFAAIFIVFSEEK